MKKWTRFALAFGLCLCLLVCGALAADAADIAVQLDGQSLAFTDAVPQVKDQRTFLPFRAVFEAMGAQVSNEGSVITATRGDKTLVMTLGSNQATVTTKGVTLPVNMDVAPYVDPTTWRTYVPVRFAAQAFDCVVGWDQSAATAIIIDTEKLVDNAMAGKSFTYLEKLNAMDEKYNVGIWDATASFDANIAMLGMPITIDGSMVFTTQDAAKMDVGMNMKMDMSAMLQMQSLLGGQSASVEDQALAEAMKTKGVDMSMKGDLSTGKLYVNMDLTRLGQAPTDGYDSHAWYELDMAQLTAQSGMDWTSLMDMSKNADMLDMLRVILSANGGPTDATTAYPDFKAVVEELLAAFSDQSFVLQDGRYVTQYSSARSEAAVTIAVALTLDGETLKSYTLGMDMATQAEGQTAKTNVIVTMDNADHMTANMTMDAGGLMSMGMNMACDYTPGAQAPDITIPAGSTVVPFTQLIGAQ